ncbi:transcriptional regulator [Mycobacterium sp. CBMA271]|uniref:RrF2 family transcriptional regulator n=1 Tax=unclassified Mycobacteroides TaxID=2618759 RepID=UPI0012DC3C3F|nr:MULTISPECIES: Rrf2 family transcriptional regulator [unclassified Mycobacteroides]MUM18890.1 transcriptional regulator [Mycobacteroides sp. CBMA 326]MUM23170.1 transcriptional regulator [Mycobacteroides sp. CBMA 271]
MQLTKFTDIGLRITMLLAAQTHERQLLTADVAVKLGVPYTHVSKAVARLGALGVVETVRGRHGGIRISEAGLRSPVGWLASGLEGEREVIPCEGSAACPLSKGCHLRSALRVSQSAFYDKLNDWTVQDLVAAPTGPLLRKLPLTITEGATR